MLFPHTVVYDEFEGQGLAEARDRRARRRPRPRREDQRPARTCRASSRSTPSTPTSSPRRSEQGHAASMQVARSRLLACEFVNVAHPRTSRLPPAGAPARHGAQSARPGSSGLPQQSVSSVSHPVRDVSSRSFSDPFPRPLDRRRPASPRHHHPQPRPAGRHPRRARRPQRPRPRPHRLGQDAGLRPPRPRPPRRPQEPSQAPRGLILLPTRELATQVREALEPLAQSWA